MPAIRLLGSPSLAILRWSENPHCLSAPRSTRWLPPMVRWKLKWKINREDHLLRDFLLKLALETFLVLFCWHFFFLHQAYLWYLFWGPGSRMRLYKSLRMLVKHGLQAQWWKPKRDINAVDASFFLYKVEPGRCCHGNLGWPWSTEFILEFFFVYCIGVCVYIYILYICIMYTYISRYLS